MIYHKGQGRTEELFEIEGDWREREELSALWSLIVFFAVECVTGALGETTGISGWSV